MLMQFFKEMLQLIGGIIFFYFVYIFFTKKNDKPAGDTPSMAHTALRELVERAVDEARKLPGLGDTVSSNTQENTTISEHSYEDLLAAAIINKVIEKCQKDSVDGNDNDLHEKTQKVDKNKSVVDEGVDEDSSSIEPGSLEDNVDGGGGFKIHRRTRIQDPLSLTIEEQIEEVTTVYTSDEDPGTMKTNLLNFRNAKRVPFPEFGMDIVDPSQESSEESQDEIDEAVHVDHITPVETWEQNWLFQQKKIHIKSEPVSMLVPNPSDEYRVLIGDKNADDTSDLSEFSAHSDDEVEEELQQAINRVVPNSITSSTNTKEQEQEENPATVYTDDKLNSMDPIIVNDNEHENQLIATFTITSDVTGDGTGEKEIEKTKLNTGESFNAQHYVNENEEMKGMNGKNEQINNNNYNNNSNSNSKIDENVNNYDNSDVATVKNEIIVKKNSVNNRNIDDQYNDTEDTLKVEILPKTPTPTPVRNSLSENDTYSTCDFQELNKKLGSIGANICENDEIFDIDDESLSDNEENLNLNNNYNKKQIDIGEFLASTDGVEVNENDEESLQFDERKCRAVNVQTDKIGGISKSSSNHKIIHDGDLELSAPPRPGTIAEREHKKWENAPPIQNNPYSQENIKKRLLERQYTSRPSDVGNTTVLPSSVSPPLQIVLGSSRPDIKRFGRDYYINESKSPTGERQLRSAASNSSRPSSSLSHRSSSTSSDFEQQEPFEPIEAATKSVELMQNNKFLERERKNSKNEINAKLNNKQGNLDHITTIIGTKNTLSDDNIQRKIRRIDLRAYGFENEFNNNNSNKDIKKSHRRIPNKLDLRLFGYDSGLRRAQSNNQLESKVNNNHNNNSNSFINLKTNNGQSDDKSNLLNYDSIDEYNWNKSAENLCENKKIIFDKFDPIKSAKSVPNISKIGVYSYHDSKISSPTSDDDSEFKQNNNDEIYNNNNNDVNPTKIKSVNKLCADEMNSAVNVNSYESDSQSSKAESDEFLRRFSANKEFKYSTESLEGADKFMDPQMPMPSVRKLAQAFNNTPEEVPTPRTIKPANIINKDRPKTPEVQIIGTPRQMHSLTARSLSKEFREGLRQIGSKPNAPTSIIIEQSKLPAGAIEKNSIYAEKPVDTGVIAPGKLKNDIKFWEQLQKKNEER